MKPKDEALRALDHALSMLGDGEPIDGLRRTQLAATLEYARGNVAAIVPVQRVYRPRTRKASAEPA